MKTPRLKQSAPTSNLRASAARHGWPAFGWIGVYLVLVCVPIAVVFLNRVPAGVEFWWDFSMGLGLAGLSMMGIQFALTARIRKATAPFGVDLVYAFHRYLALVGFAIVGGHFFILWILYPDALGSLDPRVAAWQLTVARVALLAFGLAVVTAEFRKPLRLEYGAWRYLHVALAIIGLAAAIAHVVGAGRLSLRPTTFAVWVVLTAFWMAVVLWLRLMKPLLQKARPYRVVEVRPERGDAWTLCLEPDGWQGISMFSPGQFAWLGLRNSSFALDDHPFSISSAPSALPRIEMTIKALGDFTSKVRDTPVGSLATVDGPFGVFTVDRYPSAAGFVFVAGGIGITPVMSMLRALRADNDQRPLWLFYANPDWEGVTYREELDELAEHLSLTVVHVIENPPDGFDGETGQVDEALLSKHMATAEWSSLRYFLCGPTPMTDAVEAGLQSLGAPSSHIRTELFELA